ncbi:DUF5723 family protein [Roseivirga pacifica]|uniref:DUF5723 family protein n=1 Tax=Roseivirga pacifica TaxID=1267423 RepID=UPI003BAA597F
MRKLIITIVLVTVTCLGLNAQSYFAFYELRDVVHQTQTLQPAFIPNNSLTVSLPALNFGTSFQGDFKLEEFFYREPGENDFTVNFNVLRAAAQENNHLNTDITNNLMHVGLKTKKGGFSFFVNMRTVVNVVYKEEFMDFLANGNGNRIGETIDFSGTRLKLNGITEYGIGHTRKFLKDRLVVGARVKLLNGVFHGSISDNFSGTLTTHQDTYAWSVTTRNGSINTAGFDYLTDNNDAGDKELLPYAISNENTGVGFDIGAKFDVLDWLRVEAAWNDIGKINWKEEVRNYNTADGTVEFSGVNLRGLDDLESVVKDSLLNKFDSNETEKEFSSAIGYRLYFTATANITPKNRFSLTYFKSNALEEIPANYALSFNHRLEKFVFAVVGSYRGANHEMNLGASIGSDIGPVQLYMALDNALVINKPEQYSKADFRFGINLMFGYKKWRKSPDIVDLDKL